MKKDRTYNRSQYPRIGKLVNGIHQRVLQLEKNTCYRENIHDDWRTEEKKLSNVIRLMKSSDY